MEAVLTVIKTLLRRFVGSPVTRRLFLSYADGDKAHAEVIDAYADFPSASFKEEYSSDTAPAMSIDELKVMLKDYI